ncbi:hypothetical protein [Flavobacterium sp.]|uniref:hypothetical protein n=1 Tax=Flavobacterium sp. TaxID=239 RepID=UPI003D0A09C8
MKGLYFILTALFVNFGLLSQSDETGVIAKIKSLDKEFWSDYNNCQIATLKNHLDEQIEFYHDKGGMLVGADNLVNSIKKNLCSVKNYKIRREVLPNTENFSILRNQGIIYGVIYSGEHLFYLTLEEKKEFADGRAKFLHLWILENNHWKMKRILSYEHKAVN